MTDAPEGFVGNWAATQALHVAYVHEHNVSEARRHLSAGANPCWDPEPPSLELSVVYTAVDWGDVRFLRIVHAYWSRIDVLPSAEHYPLLDFALREEQWESAECLMELGLSYKHLKNGDKSQLPLHYFYGKGLDARLKLALLCSRFDARVERATLAASALLSRASRRHWGRDVARILARMVWGARRGSVWETEEAADKWHEERLKKRK